MNQKGFLQELEIIFTNNPIKSFYPDYTSQRIENVSPIFENNFLEEKATIQSLLYIDSSQHRSFLLFKPNIKAFDLQIFYKNINFLFVNNELIGIETLTIMDDYDDLHQTRGLHEKAGI